jgi:acyl transferase domain-containing protein
LQLEDCDAAVVAGTNIIMDVQHQLIATKLGILSKTSTCHTFDESADGFGRAEGITALYIKRLSSAIANGDPIRGVIRATAINTNGKGHGINHPGLSGQEAVIRKAYSKARLSLAETGFVECHGTGTPVGDPIEVAAIGKVFAEARTPETSLLLTAIKSNTGHTEAASGIASIQKVILSLEKGIIPAVVGIRRLNPAREFSIFFIPWGRLLISALSS